MTILIRVFPLLEQDEVGGSIPDIAWYFHRKPGMEQTVNTIQARKLKIRGVVQGVGFRPFVYQLALRNHLNGHVFNTSGDVTIHLEGLPGDMDSFISMLRESPPPQSSIESISLEARPVEGFKSFEISESLIREDEYQLVSPDITTCRLCTSEIFDPSDRRYQYPFTNCTNCGPRFTIIDRMPYDRPNTTMGFFTMCPECSREYHDPNNRRFHAQPNACPVCGPSLQLADPSGNIIEGNPLTAAADLLKQGRILAIKGLGGFLLACDASNDRAVALLRERKRRRFKPFAVMVSGIEEAKRYCEINPEEERILTSTQSPVVLLKNKAPSIGMSPLVAPNTIYTGIMLPYTPLHHLLLEKAAMPLIMTSGNISEEPITAGNEEAFRRLSGIAEYFLIHNRDICSRYDDSVVMVVDNKARIVRRARGFAPYPIHLNYSSRGILACGAEVKNSFCLTRENHAFLSQHIGDLENLETLEHFEDTIGLYKRLFHIEPEIVAYDMHPDYLSTRYALDLARTHGIRCVPVQHHHAHIVSCMADNGVTEPVIGVAFDGTGYGEDGTIWGGEFLLADYSGFKRLAHFEYVPLPGGKGAIEKPYRMALSYLFKIFGDQTFELDLPFIRNSNREEMGLIRRQIEQKVNTPFVSSCGRLFDAVSALLEIRKETDYEGQAAVELEAIADIEIDNTYPFEIMDEKGTRVVSFDRTIKAIVEDIAGGIPASEISGRFHGTIADAILKICRILVKETGINRVALSGGVFQNRLLLEKTLKRFEAEGMKVLVHHNVPANDGGIALGQAVIANCVSGEW